MHTMARQQAQARDDIGSVRATISFPASHYAELERLAKEKKVSVAWIVREAVERYLADKWPLLGTP